MNIASDEDLETIRVKAEAEFEKHRTHFFAEIGQCITRYQRVEDYLPEVFSAALGGNAEKAAAIFAIDRGLDTKLKMILASLTGADKANMSCWNSLSKRVCCAAKVRNTIAHAIVVQNFGSIKVPPSEPGVDVIITFPSPRMELQKRIKTNKNVWTIELMIEEAKRITKLYNNLWAFSMTLRGEEPPQHLLEE